MSIQVRLRATFAGVVLEQRVGMCYAHSVTVPFAMTVHSSASPAASNTAAYA